MTDLTPNELRDLRLLAEGLTHKEIASRVGCGTSTVKTRLSNAYNKLGADSAIGALLALGWLRVPDDEEQAMLSAVARLHDAITEAHEVLAHLEKAA